MAEEGTKAQRHAIDFTNVKEGRGVNPVRMPEGDYEAKVTGVTESMKDDVPMWCFVLQLSERASATYAYYCKLQENQLWKVRNLLIAAGKQVPKKRVNVDPNNVVGAIVGITLVDDEYEGKEKSTIDAIFPASELADEPEPAQKASKGKAEAAPADDEDDADEALEDDLDLDDL